MNRVGLVGGVRRHGGPFVKPLASGNGDPFFSSVVLLVHGSSFTDKSPLANVATITAATANDVATLNSAVAGGAISSTSTSGSMAYASSTNFNVRLVFTVEFWVRFPSLAFCILGGQTSGTRALRSTDGTAINYNDYGSTFSTPVIANTWMYVRLVSDGTNTSMYTGVAGDANALRTQTAVVGSNIATATGYDIISTAGGLGAIYKIMEYRFTQGVARNLTSLTSIPMQSAPWPDSA